MGWGWFVDKSISAVSGLKSWCIRKQTSNNNHPWIFQNWTLVFTVGDNGETYPATPSFPVLDSTPPESYLKMFFCAISGEPPQDPVVSSKSGHVYERRLILKYITDNGTDPITGEKLEEADLVTVKASKYYANYFFSCHSGLVSPPLAPLVVVFNVY